MKYIITKLNITKLVVLTLLCVFSISASFAQTKFYKDSSFSLEHPVDWYPDVWQDENKEDYFVLIKEGLECLVSIVEESSNNVTVKEYMNVAIANLKEIYPIAKINKLDETAYMGGCIGEILSFTSIDRNSLVYGTVYVGENRKTNKIYAISGLHMYPKLEKIVDSEVKNNDNEIHQILRTIKTF